MPSFIYIHIGLVRKRVVGAGNLDMRLLGYDDIESADLLPIPMRTTDKAQRDRLTTFTSQASKLRVSVDVIDEWFRIDASTVFIAPQWSSGPLVD